MTHGVCNHVESPSLLVLLLLLLEQLTKVVSYFIRTGCNILVVCLQ